MKSSVDFAQGVSAVGYVRIAYEDEFVSSEKCIEDALIDPRWKDHDIQQLDAAMKRDPVMSLRDKGNALLFRTFAQLETRVGEEGAILEFASRYGLLGAPAKQTINGVTRHAIVNPFGPSNLVTAERIQDWCIEISKMREALKRFDLLMQCEQDDLEGYKKVTARERLHRLFYGGDTVQLGGLERVYSGDETLIREDFKSSPEIFRYCDDGEVERAERAYVGLVVNRELHRHTSLTLAWNLQKGKHKLQYRTTALIGALWLQFAEYLTEVRRLNFCRMCNEPIPIVGRSARIDKDLCSDKCRQQASRKGKTVRSSKKGA